MYVCICIYVCMCMCVYMYVYVYVYVCVCICRKVLLVAKFVAFSELENTCDSIARVSFDRGLPRMVILEDSDRVFFYIFVRSS